MATWKDLLPDASNDRTLERARGVIGKGVKYKLGKGGFDPVKEMTGASDCSGFVAWAIGIPRELPPGSGRWLSTDQYWSGGSPVADGLFDPVTPGEARTGDLYVYPDHAGRQGHIGVITGVRNGRPDRVVHCSMGNFRRSADAVEETDTGVFDRNERARVLRVDYEALRELFGVPPAERRPRLLLGRWTGSEGTGSFTYRQIHGARFENGGVEASPSAVGSWLGRRDRRTRPRPLDAILEEWGFSFWTDHQFRDDLADPRVYVNVAADIDPAPREPRPSVAGELRHGRLKDEPVLKEVLEGRRILRASGGIVGGAGVIQDALNHLARSYPEYHVDLGSGSRYRGFFGTRTRQAVRNFQATHGLQPDGEVGPDTLRALDAALLAFDAQGSADPTRTPPPSAEHRPSDDFRTAFLRSAFAPAQASQRETKVPASITLAQAILESNWGRSRLCAEANNYFGIKGTGPAGSVIMPTFEYINGQRVRRDEPFRVYNSMEESFRDHGNLIAFRRWRNSDRLIYEAAMRHTDDFRRFAEALEGVYATDPAYAELLTDLIDRYELDQFDV